MYNSIEIPLIGSGGGIMNGNDKGLENEIETLAVEIADTKRKIQEFLDNLERIKKEELND